MGIFYAIIDHAYVMSFSADKIFLVATNLRTGYYVSVAWV